MRERDIVLSEINFCCGDQRIRGTLRDRLMLELLLDIREELGRLNNNVIDVETAVEKLGQSK